METKLTRITEIAKEKPKERFTALYHHRGHYNYYGVTDNYRMIRKYHDIVIRLLFKWLNVQSKEEFHLGEIQSLPKA